MQPGRLVRSMVVARGSIVEPVQVTHAPVTKFRSLSPNLWRLNARNSRKRTGRPSTGNAKEQVSARLDRDVLAALRQAGPEWQSQINPLLRVALDLDVNKAV